MNLNRLQFRVRTLFLVTAMAALNASGDAPSVLPVSSDISTTLFIVSGVNPSLSRIARPLRVMTELSMPKGQYVAQRRHPVQL